MHTIYFNGTAIPYRIRESEKARHGRLVVSHDGVEIITTRRTGPKAMFDFLEQRKIWVFDQYVRLKERKPKMHPPLKLKEGSVFPLLGVETPLIFTRTSQRTVQVTREKGAVVIAVPEGVAREDRDFLVRQAFKRWLREYLRERSELIMARYTPQIRRCPRMLKLKTMKSRWGSCGPDGIINLNDVLVFAPARALEYVLVHELCHLIHRDHSERFWGLVERLMPNFETQREWLKIHGDGLHQLMQE